MTTTLRAACCPICGNLDHLNVGYPCAYAICPECEHLAYVVRNRLHHESGVPLEDIRLESFLADDLGLESLEEVEAIFAIEEELAVRFPSDTDVNFPETVRDIVEYVRRCRVEQ